MTTGKTIALAIWTFVGNVMSLILNILSICHSFYFKKQVSFNFMVAVTFGSDFGAEENNLSLFSIVSPSICHEVLGLNAMILSLGMLSFRPAFSLSSFIFIKRLFAAAAAKLLQSCLTLCYPIDGSPPGSPIPGILQARILEWVAMSFSNKRLFSSSSFSAIRVVSSVFQGY